MKQMLHSSLKATTHTSMLRPISCPKHWSRCFTSGTAGRSRVRSAVVANSETEGIQKLLARDRKVVQTAPELDLTVEQPEIEEEVDIEAETETVVESAVIKSRRQRRRELAKAASGDDDQSASPSPTRCRDAIEAGLKLFKNKEYEKAIAMLNLSLELPGNGAYRLSGSPREYSCPSDAEENTALYNMACAYAQLGQRSSVLTCLEGVLENGFDQYETIRGDPDLAPARGAELDALLAKYDNPVAKVRKMFSKDTTKSDTSGKPWILW